MNNNNFNSTKINLNLPPARTNLINAPKGSWNKTFGGSADDWGYSVQQTADGGYIIAGSSAQIADGYFVTDYATGPKNTDVWLIKTDERGNKLWDKTFGGSGIDWGDSVQQTADGGYIVTAHTGDFGAGRSDIWLIKTDERGNKLWDKTFGGSGPEDGGSVQQTTDGGYVVAARTDSYGAGRSDIWLIKTDASGNRLWDKTFGGSGYDWGDSVQQTDDGGYVVAGSTESYGAGNMDVWLIKTDASGNKLWDKTFGGSSIDWGDSVLQTVDGGYIVIGSISDDIWLIKTDASGNKLWDKTFGGSGIDDGDSVQQTADGGYIVAGSTAIASEGKWNFSLVRTDASGNKLWDKTFGGSGSDQSSSVQQTADGGYIIAGTTESYGAGRNDVWLIKIDANGN